jgi:hypothetical protein
MNWKITTTNKIRRNKLSGTRTPAKVERIMRNVIPSVGRITVDMR